LRDEDRREQQQASPKPSISSQQTTQKTQKDPHAIMETIVEKDIPKVTEDYPFAK